YILCPQLKIPCKTNVDQIEKIFIKINLANKIKRGKWVPLCCTLGTVWIIIRYIL
ncbi:hypothetical protein FWK35_00005421, partial [Aphis craccivora]